MIKPNYLLFFLAVFALLMSHPFYGQITSSEVDELVARAMDTFNTAGVAVAIVKDGEIIHQRGYGVKSVITKEAVDEHTNFAIASNSKAFTTAALALLVEEGKISWTDRVKEYIPEFKLYNPYVTENFNIQDLLTHRSGLGLGAGDLMHFPDSADFTIADVLTNMQYFEPQSGFRTKFDYDNNFYLVAGELIKRVSGMNWEKFVEARILEPLNMDHTYTSLYYIDDLSNVATPHLDDDGTFEVLSHTRFDPEKMNGAAGAIYSNVNDLANWMLVHLNHGKYGEELEKQLFTQASQDEMWKIHTTTNASKNPRYNSHFKGYGLGWYLEDAKGNMMVSHTGGLAGMLSRTVMIPDLNLGVVVLTNTWIGGAGVYQSVSQTIVDSYLGLDSFDWVEGLSNYFQQVSGNSDSVTQQVWETVAVADDSQVDPADYVGVYEDRWFGKVTIYKERDQLWFKSHRSPKLTGPMSYYQANAFAIKWAYPHMEADAFAIFSLDEAGKADRIRMKGIAPDIDFSYDFQDLDLKRVKE